MVARKGARLKVEASKGRKKTRRQKQAQKAKAGRSAKRLVRKLQWNAGPCDEAQQAVPVPGGQGHDLVGPRAAAMRYQCEHCVEITRSGQRLCEEAWDGVAVEQAVGKKKNAGERTVGGQTYLD